MSTVKGGAKVAPTVPEGAPTMTPTAALQAALSDLDGPTIGPADPGYDTAKSVYNAMIDKSPALIAQVRTVADVDAASTPPGQRSAPRHPRWRSQRARSGHLRRRARSSTSPA